MTIWFAFAEFIIDIGRSTAASGVRSFSTTSLAMTDRRELPTASRRGDLSRNGRASAASAGRESALFGAYRHPAPVIVDQPCACGGVIRATMDDIAEIVTAIRCHQETTIHLIWRWREEIA